MDENVQLAPSRANLLEDRLQLPRDGNVDLARDRGFELSGERFDKTPRFSFSHETARSAPTERNALAQP